MATEQIIDERGSLVLKREGEDDYTVHFADHFNHKGFGSLQAVADWREIFSDTVGHQIKLNGSQAVTVKNWAEEYL